MTRRGLPALKQVFFDPLTRLRAEVETDGGGLLVVLIPSKEELYGAAAYPPVLRAVREVRAGLDSLGLPTIDLYQAMRTGAGDGAPFFSRDIHFTPLGNRLVAEALADSITARHQAFRWDRPPATTSRAR
jgi:lysophospholipase L1-like esterase